MPALTQRLHQMATRVRRENIFFFFSLSMLMVTASQMVFSLVALRFVSPALMGIWQTLILIQTYANVLTLGITHGLNRELPFYLGQGKQEKAYDLVATAQFYLLILGLLGAVFFIGTALLSPNLSVEWRLALAGSSAYWLTNLATSYLSVTFRAKNEFRRLTIINFISFGFGLLSVVLVIIGGFTGMVMGAVLLNVLATVLMHYMRPIRLGPRFIWQRFRLLLGAGVPLYMSNYFLTTSLSFAQTIILWRGSIELVGAYTPVAAIDAVLSAIFVAIFQYIFPRIVLQFGSRGDRNSVRRGVWYMIGITATVTIPIAIVGEIVLPWLWPVLFSRYAVALPAAQIALIGGIFLAIDSTQAGLYALKAWRYVTVYTVCAVALRWTLPWLFTHSGNVLTDVAMGLAVANGLTFLIGTWLVWHATQVRQSLTQAITPVKEEVTT